MAKEINLSDLLKIFNKKGKQFRLSAHREINLVPEIKDEMIKALKLRNFIFFICIVVASASVGVTLFFGTIVGGQSIAINSKKGAIEELSNKINNYKEISDYLTIKGQVENIDSITNNKRMISRTFDILLAMMPKNEDEIKISTLSIDTSNEAPVFKMEAQANAGVEPFIDYRVLDGFQKGLRYLTYDYGRYRDKNDKDIPTYCIIETNQDGNLLKTEEGNYYGLWTINEEGCDPSATKDDDGKETNTASEYELEDYDGQKVVRIWRTPQLSWYHSSKSSNDSSEPSGNGPNMTEDGVITNVAHFNSECIHYKVETRDGEAKKIDSSDNSCYVVAGGDEAVKKIDSSNGRSDSEDLVLRFELEITLDPGVYSFNSHHFMAISPSSRYNVTDSYVQVQNMFTKRAKDCAPDDADCKSETNQNGGN